MKKTFFCFLLSVLFVFNPLANATLWDRGGGLIYDDALNMTWLQDANYVNSTGYDDLLYGYDTGGQIKVEDALIWAENLEYYDPVRKVTWSNWRLPKTMPINGVSYNYTYSYDGSADFGYNISAPGSAFPYSTNSEMAYMFYNNLGNIGDLDVNGDPVPNPGLENTSPFLNLMEALYWSETPMEQRENYYWTFGFYDGYQQSDGIADQLNRYAWAVMDGDVACSYKHVPEPATMLLLGCGLLGLIGFRRKFRKG